MTVHRKPINDAELLASLTRRVAALEQRDKSPAGGWTLRENSNGDLIATKGGVTVVLSDVPEQVTVVREVAADTEEPGT